MRSVYRRLNAAVATVLLVAAIGGGLACRSALVSWWTRITAPASAVVAPVRRRSWPPGSRGQ